MGRCDVDDATPAFGLHVGHRAACGVKCGGQINGQNGIPLGQRKFLDGADVLNTGVVHQNIDTAECVGSALHHGFNGLGLAHVGAVVNDLNAELLFQPGTDAFDFSRIAESVDDEVDAGFRKTLCNAQTDATG